MTNNYDYIIVGSGPGGCAIATVLSSKSKNKVLMVEAGDDKDTNELIYKSTNAGMLEEDHFPEFFWTVPQVVQENVEMEANYTNGRLLGGGSSVNGEQYVRGSKNVFKKWYEITKDPDWSPDAIFSIYKKITKVQAIVSDPSKGKHGPICIREAPTIPTETTNKCVQAISASLDLVEIQNYNDPSTPFGPFKRWQYYQKPIGFRESSSTALLKPILLTRDNFTLSKKSTVLRILWKKNIAIGVEYLHNGKIKEAYASQRVILCAGTQTPLILQYSGVGNGIELKKLGIKTVSNLPNVGKNLANHLILSTIFSKNINDLVSTDINALYSFGAFLPQPINPDADEPRGSEWIGVDTGSNLIMAILQTNPFSRGYAKIQSSDPLTAPLVSEAALDDVRDLQFFKDLIRNQLIPVANQLHIIDSEYTLLSPDPLQVNDDDYLTEYIKTHLSHAHHWQSQCIMGPKENGCVVDSNGSVYGTHHLTIADDCIAPVCLDGNTAGEAYIIGFTIGKKILMNSK
jgi:choline dehydrogenase